MMDHLTRFAVLLLARKKVAETVAHTIIERTINIVGPPKTLHSDQGTEFGNRAMHHLQQILGYKRPERRRTGPKIIQLQHLHHAQIAGNAYCDRSQHLASLLPTLFLLLGRKLQLAVLKILGIRHVKRRADTEELAQHTRDKFANSPFELARRSPTEREEIAAENYSVNGEL